MQIMLRIPFQYRLLRNLFLREVTGFFTLSDDLFGITHEIVA